MMMMELGRGMKELNMMKMVPSMMKMVPSMMKMELVDRSYLRVVHMMMMELEQLDGIEQLVLLELCDLVECQQHVQRVRKQVDHN